MQTHFRTVQPWLILMLRRLWLGGIATVVLFPAARGSSEWLGWMPLWLVLMPALALWGAEGFVLPSHARFTRRAFRHATHLLPRRPQAVRLRRRAQAPVAVAENMETT